MDFVKALIAFDAELNILNRDSLTALDIAEDGDCADIAILLKDMGGLTAWSILDGAQSTENYDLILTSSLKHFVALQGGDGHTSTCGPSIGMHSIGMHSIPEGAFMMP